MPWPDLGAEDPQMLLLDINTSDLWTGASKETLITSEDPLLAGGPGSNQNTTGLTVEAVNSSSGGSVSVRDESLVVWEIVTLLAIFVLTVLGNVVVLFMLLVRRKKLTRMCYFILSLCISDLITAFFNVLPQLVWEITYRFRGGGFLCKAVKFAQLLGPYLNSYLLVMTALDRYQVICYPLSNCAWTPRRSKNMIYLAWALALGSCTPQVFVFSYQEVGDGTWDCWASFIPPWGTRAYVTWYALSVFILPLFFLVIVYTCICRTLWVNFKLKQMDVQRHRWNDLRRPRLLVRLRAQRNRSDGGEVSTCLHNPRREKTMPLLEAPSTTSTTSHKATTPKVNRPSCMRLPAGANPRSHSIRSISRAKIKTVKLTVTVIFCYVSCSAPFISVQLWHVWDPEAATSPFYSGAAFTILTLLSSLNSVVNPWIFLAFNENLLQILRSICTCRFNMRWGPWANQTFRSSDSNKNFRLTVFTTTEADHPPASHRPSLSPGHTVTLCESSNGC
ncbi:vasopressin V1a receptor-like [Eriocheir sinensis]|uniref:vasopressin V1a receptor-like n=1 Tax=Eriocheir sinensis TaxID=95602 RepID=UPI0021CA8E77|nr:vasopressin V1a receptor-like [Eriocheir sinensis]XP_050722276.1 vasopressin V1a receptor-like [Eriocheir sinensis]XP_050722277.1 vasopressin V1a receptor-like [Eriocheir sinensis]XP_050722278.1 vasopressin V1a receptor-like [Eriocheir sinensis]